MKQLLLLFMLLLVFGSTSCEKETESGPRIPLVEEIKGDWLVVYKMHKQNNFTFEDQKKGVVTAWPCYYVLSVDINDDHSYTINNSDVVPANDKHTHTLGGTWFLDAQDNITFFCDRTHSTSFKASINKEGQLVLENDEILLHHNKKQ